MRLPRFKETALFEKTFHIHQPNITTRRWLNKRTRTYHYQFNASHAHSYLPTHDCHLKSNHHDTSYSLYVQNDSPTL